MENPKPCPRCLKLAQEQKIPTYMVMPLPEGALAPLDYDGNKCCFDCQAADTLIKFGLEVGFPGARLATGNDRQEQMRLPGAPIGLAQMGLMKPSKEGDLDEHIDCAEVERPRHYRIN